MQLTRWTVCIAGLISAISILPAQAQEQEAGPAVSDPAATFTDIRDAVPNKFFDSNTTAVDPLNPNRLIIGFETGLDITTFKNRDFRASTTAFNHSIAMDTIRFRVEAPEGYYVATITYSQRGAGSVVRTGRAAGSANWVVGGYASDLGQFLTNPTLSWTMDLTEKNLTSVPVSITDSLFVFSTPALGSANVSLLSADVVVTLVPIPAPEPPVVEPEVVVPVVEVEETPVEGWQPVPEADAPLPAIPALEVTPVWTLPFQWFPIWIPE
jgi:hypothetical protein